MLLKFLKSLNTSFSVKLFFIFTAFMFVVFSLLNIFYYKYQCRLLTDALVNNGKMLSKILAYNSRIGVFSEDADFLKDPVKAVFQVDEVVDVLVLNKQMDLLLHKARDSSKNTFDFQTEKNKNLPPSLSKEWKVFFSENKKNIQFWAPVLSKPHYSGEEAMFFSGDIDSDTKQVTGFISITLSKASLNSQLKNQLMESIAVGLIFWSLGSFLIFLMAKKITRPLVRLTTVANILGMGGDVDKIPVETKDEIGNLAKAFNEMFLSLKKREKEKQILEEQLRHSHKMEAVGTLAGGVAHDFNNILTAILGYGELLRISLEDATQAMDYVTHILLSADRASDLTKSLLAFSRKQLIKPSSVNINKLVCNSEPLLTRIIREDINLKLEIHNESLIVIADSGQIDQILLNLAANAKDAMPNGGVLTISTKCVDSSNNYLKNIKKTGKYALLSVSDTGTGIENNILDKIFDPFFTTKEAGKGTGLGLSMIYGIVKQHNGFIDVTSKKNIGTAFKIYLPITQNAIPEDEKPQTIHKDKIKGTETVLIAEDDEHVRTLSKKVLLQYGYKVIEAVDGGDAVIKFIQNKNRIHIVVLDVIMPVKNGKQVYHEIIKIKSDVKVLFISGYTDKIIKDEEILEGKINFISKPVAPAILLQKIRQVLDKKPPALAN